MKVLVNNGVSRKELDAELIKETATTVIVRLPDGKVISRKKKRDLPTA